MLFSTNPGIAPADVGPEYDLSMVGAVLGIGVVVLVITSIVRMCYVAVESRRGIHTNADEHGAFWLTVGILAFVYAGLSSVIAVVATVAVRNDAAQTAYVHDVQHWLAADYGIRASQDDVATLIAGDDLAVKYDGQFVGIETMRGPGSTLQLRAVGGQVLQPRD